jgi:hypothetical protein
VLAKAMAKSAGLRYDTCAEFAADLGRALGLLPGQPSVSPPPDSAAARPATELAMPIGSPPPTQAVTPGQVAAATMAPPQVVPAGAGVDAATMAAMPPATGSSGPGQQGAGGQPGWPGQQGAGVATPAPPGTYQQPGPYPQYPPGGGTAPQGWPPQYPPPAKKSKGVLLGAVGGTVVVAVAVAAVVVVLGHKTNSGGGPTNPPSTSSSSSSSSTPPPTSPAQTAQSEATAVNNLLTNMANSRGPLQSAVSNVGNCTNLSGDITQLQQIAGARQGELNSAQSLQTGALSNGGTAQSELVTALRLSLRIDNDYLSWARDQQANGCGSYSSAYQDANAHNNEATNDKIAFLNTWNPIASQYGLPQYSAGQI